MLRSLLLVSLLFVGTVHAQDVLTVDQAIEIALKNNFEILLAKNDAEIARLYNSPGNAGMLPKLNATLTDNFSYYNLNQKLANGTETNKNGVTGNTITPSLNLSWTLFDGLKMFATKGRLNRMQEIGQLNMKDTLQTMVAQVISAYYNVVGAKQQLQSINEAIALYDETSKLADMQFKVGTSAKTAYLQARVDLNAAKAQALTQQAAILQNKAALNALLARPVETEFEVLDTIIFNPDPAMMSPEDLDKNNFQVLVAAKNIEVAKYGKREVFSQMLPNLTVGGSTSNAGFSFTRTQNSAGFSLYNQTYGPNVGFTLGIPIFNGLVYLRQNKIAQINILNSQFKYDKVRLQNRVNYYNAIKNFAVAKEALNLEEENILLARENADIARSRFKLGQSNAIELRQAQQSYVDAMTRLVNARYNAKVTETELMRLQGTLVK